MAERHIVAGGGYSLGTKLDDYVLSLARRPRVLFVPTASADDSDLIVRFYAAYGERAETSHLPFWPWPPADIRALVLGHDVVLVGGGNAVNMLAVWRVHGFDAILREAWESGVVLAGWSAGMMCWFEAGVTDSFGPHLEGLRDGLGFLTGSACPHYDGEELRRPRYHDLLRDGFPGGWAAEDLVALHFVGTELREVVAAEAGKAAYRVALRDGEVVEERIDARLLRC